MILTQRLNPLSHKSTILEEDEAEKQERERRAREQERAPGA